MNRQIVYTRTVTREEIPRRSLATLREHLAVFRVVVLDGPRQAGKSTLLRQWATAEGRTVVTFDDRAELSAAIADPDGYLASLPRPVAIDEYQRAGNDLLFAIKRAVDDSPDRGQFILAGSTTFLRTTQLAETLAGRVGLMSIWPLSRGEILRRNETFLAELVLDVSAVAKRGERITTGGYPESVLASSERARALFLRNFTQTVLSREAVLDAGEHRDDLTLRRVFAALAARTAGELNISDLAADLQLNRATVTAHVALLETLRQIVLIQPWATSAATRAKRRSKVMLADSGVAATQLGATTAGLHDLKNADFGPLLETFVIGELLRQAAWADDIRLAHYRDRDGREVDLIVVSDSGIVGIEVKATSSPDRRAANHLEYLATRAGAKWQGGVVLHTGAQTAQIGDRIHAVPISRLWS